MIKNIFIPFRKTKIKGNLHVNKRSKILIVLCHGFQDSKDLYPIKRFAELVQNKHNVFRFTFTDGKKPSLPIQSEDISAIVKYFSSSYEKIVLLGASLGGLSALLSIKKNPRIDRLILFNPFVYFFKKIAWRFRKMPISMLLFYPFVKDVRNNLNFYFKTFNTKSIKIPTLLIVASKDNYVDPIHGKTLYKQLASKQKKLILDDIIDHGLSKNIYIERVANYVINWLQENA